MRKMRSGKGGKWEGESAYVFLVAFCNCFFFIRLGPSTSRNEGLTGTNRHNEEAPEQLVVPSFSTVLESDLVGHRV